MIAQLFISGLAMVQLSPRDGDLKVGDIAPKTIGIQLADNSQFDLSKLKGKPVVLIFGSCT